MRHNKETRYFFRLVNNERKLFTSKVKSFKDKEGNLLTDKSGVLEEWRSYFNDLFNPRNEGRTQKEEETKRSQLKEQEMEPSDEEEIAEAISKFKNNKAPGADALLAELLKCGGNELIKALQDLLNVIWTDEEMPSDCSRSIVCPIHKKGD